MNREEWIERYVHRMDITSRLTHLTRGNNDDEAFQNLCKILLEKQLIAGSGYINGSRPACCFQEAPILSIAENLNYEKRKFEEKGNGKRYSPFGIRTMKHDIYAMGGRPVFYGNKDEYKKLLPENEYWRIVDFEFGESTVVDWTHEREWRLPQNYNFSYNKIEVILPGEEYYKKFVEWCLNEKHLNILTEISGIITIDSVIS